MKSLKTNFWLDALIFAGFLAALQPGLTGIAIHEWFTLAACGTLVLHVVLHWDWAVGVTKRFFSQLFHVSRLNYLVDALLFVAFTAVITSGLVISRVVMPALGLQTFSSRSWLEIHSASSEVTLLLVAVHFGLHWSWVKNAFQRLILVPFKPPRAQAQSRAHALPMPMRDITAP
ncbi:MAG TPA: DUF4405 domain-containing protein [Anaerolineales bacterium]|nr:DUF4405 domain-containing protein [Anaerolineales bacterium]